MHNPRFVPDMLILFLVVSTENVAVVLLLKLTGFRSTVLYEEAKSLGSIDLQQPPLTTSCRGFDYCYEGRDIYAHFKNDAGNQPSIRMIRFFCLICWMRLAYAFLWRSITARLPKGRTPTVLSLSTTRKISVASAVGCWRDMWWSSLSSMH